MCPWPPRHAAHSRGGSARPPSRRPTGCRQLRRRRPTTPISVPMMGAPTAMLQDNPKHAGTAPYEEVLVLNHNQAMIGGGLLAARSRHMRVDVAIASAPSTHRRAYFSAPQQLGRLLSRVPSLGRCRSEVAVTLHQRRASRAAFAFSLLYSLCLAHPTSSSRVPRARRSGLLAPCHHGRRA